MFEFNVGDVVRIGSNGEKGKIVDIVFPAGAQACFMYKVQLFMDGSIRTVDKISLVKGLPNELSVEQNKAAETHTAPPVPTLLYSDIFEMDNTYFDEDSVIETAPDDQITELLASVGATADYPLPDSLFDNGVDPFVAEIYDQTTTPSFQDPSVKLEPQSRFTKPVEIEQFIYENENKNTRRKTLSHQKLFECYLAEQSEDRAICEIPPTELNVYIGQFLLCVRKVDGTEYEPVTLRSILGSIERYLRRHNYGYSVISGHEFSNAREALKCKQKDLKRQGKGNKPQAADAVTEEHIDKLYESDQLGTKTPSSLINTLWFNNTLHFGMRAGGAEHRQLCWGDLQLCYDHDLQKEYIEFNERQTKTRTGEDISNTRKEKPRMYAELGHPRCPVATYKKYADKRPEKMCTNDSPFYLATITHKINPGEDERWFLSQPIGVNKLTSLLKTMATKSNLPDLPFMRITNTRYIGKLGVLAHGGGEPPQRSLTRFARSFALSQNAPVYLYTEKRTIEKKKKKKKND